MATTQFYLLGDAASTARDIEIPQSADLEELQNTVASHFAIVKPKGNTSNSHARKRHTQLTFTLRGRLHLQ